MDPMASRKKLIISSIAILMVVLSGGLIGAKYYGSQREEHKEVKNATTTTIYSSRLQLVVQRDASLVEKKLSPSSEAKGQLWEVTQPESSMQPFVINAFYEQGVSLKKLTGYTKQSLRDSVVSNVNIQLPKQFPEYRELTQRNLTINGIEANETIFEYTNARARVKQRLVLLFKNSDTAIYIRGQARSEDYEEINSRYFEPLISSAKFE
jgi:hypothetical protein